MGKVERISAATIAAGILIASTAFAYQHIAPYLSENDCILQAANTSGEVNAPVARACQRRFEGSGNDHDRVPSWVISSIEGRARFSSDSAWATLYNGDSSYTITRVRVGITDPETRDSDEPETRYYNVSVNIPPLSRRLAEINVFETYDSVSWFIDTAWGHPTE